MNPITDFIFILTWFFLLVWAIRTIVQGRNLMIEPIDNRDEDDLNRMAEESTHPELRDLKNGDEFLVVNFDQFTAPPVDKSRFKLDSPMLHDELNQSLQDRIDALNDGADGDNYDDWDDDDDGGSPVPAIR
tara:strand:- start:1931 stop:2323 length:393 start_codon:yes stop_codon:yes gene_type:complete